MLSALSNNNLQVHDIVYVRELWIQRLTNHSTSSAHIDGIQNERINDFHFTPDTHWKKLQWPEIKDTTYQSKVKYWMAGVFKISGNAQIYRISKSTLFASNTIGSVLNEYIPPHILNL